MSTQQGYEGSATLAEHWDGSAWNVVPTPDLGLGQDDLLGLSAGGGASVWAVGFTQGSTTANPSITLIEHWDGSAWVVVSSPNGGSRSNVLNAVIDLASGYQLAVGSYVVRRHELTLIEQRCGT